jgi:hypothetical protein
MDDSYITERRSQAKSQVRALVLDCLHVHYSAHRSLARRRCTLQDAVDGMKKGVEHFGSGLMKGVTGLVTNPYKEGKKGGAAGRTLKEPFLSKCVLM